MIKVCSSNIDSVGYDEASSVLSIAFLGGGFYNYTGVPVNVYQALLSAPSKGKYFHQNIKDIYPTYKVD